MNCFISGPEPEQIKTALRETLGVQSVFIGDFFSPYIVEISSDEMTAMRETVAAIETCIKTPAYQAKVESKVYCGADLPDPSQDKSIGVLMGYDFHCTANGPQLIEINTNAGFAFLGAFLIQQQKLAIQNQWPHLENELFSMFEQEFSLNGIKPGLIVIVDEDPTHQALYAEFLLFQKWAAQRNMDVEIASPQELHVEGQVIKKGGKPVCLIYNRTVDFFLTEPASHVIRTAYQNQLAIVTPNPRHYVRYAFKKNLTILSSQNQLLELGLSESVRDTLGKHIPETIEVTPNHETWLWQNRKSLFFKPMSGYGSKAVYRGEKLTKSTFEYLMSHPYIAQKFVPPPEVTPKDSNFPLKVDIRLYTYGGKVLLTLARLYQGQATNLRTTGGGFAPIWTELPLAEMRTRSETRHWVDKTAAYG